MPVNQPENWQKTIQQGVFQFTEQINRQKPGEHPWRDALDAKKTQLSEKHPDRSKAHIHACALRWLGHKFLDLIYYSQLHYLGLWRKGETWQSELWP